MWDPVLDRLAAEREVFAVDMPGFGHSPRDRACLRPPISRPPSHDGLGLDRPHVAGNSLGGWVALELALAGHARSVTAIAPAGLWAAAVDAAAFSVWALLARAMRPGFSRALMLLGSAGVGAALGSTTAYPERMPRADALAACARVRRRARVRGRQRRGCARGVFDGLAEIDVPLTLAWPEHDRLVARPRAVPAIAREVRPARLRAHAHLGRPRAGRRASCWRAARLRHATLNSPPSRIAMLAR